MVERRPQAALPVRQIAPIDGEKIQAVLNLLDDLLREKIHPGCRQQNPQRNALVQPADLRHCQAVVLIQLKISIAGAQLR